MDANGNEIVYGSAGIPLQTHYSCASSLPLGTKVYIPQLDAYYVVQDRAADWVDAAYGGMYVDIYTNNHEEALSLASGFMDVYIVQ